MKDYYLLIGLNKKEVRIINVIQNLEGVVEVEIENRSKKVRCPLCQKFTRSFHGNLKPIRSVYFDSCGQKGARILYVFNKTLSGGVKKNNNKKYSTY